MKPLFKWASSSPWTEMQLQALSAPDYATALQQIWKAVWGLVWFAVLARVLGFLMYRHYLLRWVGWWFTPPQTIGDGRWMDIYLLLLLRRHSS